MKIVFTICSNNYLGLADDPRLISAAKAAMDSHGYGMASVRFICGTQSVHKQLEDTLSEFLGTEDTILFPSCMDANAGVFEAVLNEHEEIVTEFALIGLGSAGQVNQGTVVARMAPRNERRISQQELLPILRAKLAQIPGARVFAAPDPMVQGQRGEPLQFVLTGEKLSEIGRLGRELQGKLAG